MIYIYILFCFLGFFNYLFLIFLSATGLIVFRLDSRLAW